MSSTSFNRRVAHRAARRLALWLPTVLVLVAAAAAAGPVQAHGELVLQLGAERIQPGGTLEVRGDLGSGETFEVALISKADGSRRVIATIPAVEEGHFQSFVTVPADSPTGDYLVEVSVDLVVARAPLTIAGAPVESGSGGGPDQGDGLIQPIPGSSSPGGATTGRTSPTVSAEPASSRSGRSPGEGVAIVAVAILAAAAVTGVLRLVSRRGGRSGSGSPGPG